MSVVAYTMETKCLCEGSGNPWLEGAYRLARGGGLRCTQQSWIINKGTTRGRTPTSPQLPAECWAHSHKSSGLPSYPGGPPTTLLVTERTTQPSATPTPQAPSASCPLSGDSRLLLHLLFQFLLSFSFLSAQFIHSLDPRRSASPTSA